MLHIFAALAQEDRRLISERTRSALADAKKRGVRTPVNARPSLPILLDIKVCLVAPNVGQRPRFMGVADYKSGPASCSYTNIRNVMTKPKRKARYANAR